MIPILYKTNATTPLGLLIDAISCEVTEERNGEYTLSMEYPTDGTNADLLDYDEFILAKPSADAENQLFIITKIEKGMSGQLTISANHVRYLLQNCVVMYNPSVVTGCANAISTLVSETYPTGLINRFTISADGMSTTKKFKTTGIKPTKLTELMAGEEGSLVDTFGGEWEFDNWHAILHKSRGANNGVLIQYGFNLKDLEYTISTEDVYNKYVAWYEKSDGTYGYFPYSTLGLSNLYNFEDADGNTTNFTFPKIELVDVTDLYKENGNSLTSTQVRNYIHETYDDEWKVHLDSITVDFVNLRDTTEYAEYENIANVHLCDTVTVLHSGLGISFTEKVTKTVYDSINERYNEITVGMAKKVTLRDVMLGKSSTTADIYKVDE